MVFETEASAMDWESVELIQQLRLCGTDLFETERLLSHASRTSNALELPYTNNKNSSALKSGLESLHTSNGGTDSQLSQDTNLQISETVLSFEKPNDNLQVSETVLMFVKLHDDSQLSKTVPKFIQSSDNSHSRETVYVCTVKW